MKNVYPHFMGGIPPFSVVFQTPLVYSRLRFFAKKLLFDRHCVSCVGKGLKASALYHYLGLFPPLCSIVYYENVVISFLHLLLCLVELEAVGAQACGLN